MVLTVLVGLVLSPVVTLMFGVALLPFSWPYLAAVPDPARHGRALSQGGVSLVAAPAPGPHRGVGARHLRLLSLTSALMAHLDTAGMVAVAGLAGIWTRGPGTG